MRRVAVLAISILALTGVLGACTVSAPAGTVSSSSPPSASAPSPSAASTSVGAPAAAPVDTTAWTTYVSERYGFAIGHPPDWTVEPADHDWTMEEDAELVGSTGQEAFLSPMGNFRVSAWSVSSATPEYLSRVQAWAEEYCRESGNTSCAAIGDRAVPLCNERWDCHPGLLVPFEEDVHAFVTGGDLGPRMVVVVVWRPESSGSRALLEAFLSTMDVCPSRPGTPAGCAKEVPRAGAATGDPLVTSR
ncbi:hypothetical protein [Cellulomonas sp.]|uniref:hypothetical protein n=1 Tax=Cellulomonas sp. TaxID=40001 RepID=UPI003BAA0E47